ncbi:hypothetical protein J3459_018020 [Metarhizium acridum]|nr:hypothetical protein J3459_018020 [Metarhizium acridum]
MASSRQDWEKRISDLINEAKKHQEAYSEQVGYFQLQIHPSVYSPKYFPETLWYGQNLPSIVKGGSFLEIGVGSGLISLHLAASGSKVVGADINPFAVETTQQNFSRNQQEGTFIVSDIFDKIDGSLTSSSGTTPGKLMLVSQTNSRRKRHSIWDISYYRDLSQRVLIT